jgi:hypothetical protein
MAPIPPHTPSLSPSFSLSLSLSPSLFLSLSLYLSLYLTLSFSLSLSLTSKEGVRTLASIKHACTLSVPHSVSQSVSMRDYYINRQPGAVFTKLHFRRKLKNWPNKLQRYITLGWRGLSVTNTLTYWTIRSFKEN